MKKTMLTDLYQLTMMAAYVDNNIDDVATFDLFIRKLPQDWGYFVAAGIEDAIDYATTLEFSSEDIDFLQEQNLFDEDFLDFLNDFRFEGEIYSVREGSVVFPNEPIMRVTASRTQAQFLETALLNMINYQTMVASKASRVVNAANGAAVVEFGLRRAQEEDASLKGARAAFIGGAVATSNVKAGMEYNIPITGTQAHSFIMSYENEIDAFRAYANTFPENCVLLIDTYNTLEGVRKAAIVAKEMEALGHTLKAVRLDSGDLGYLSDRVRAILDEERLEYVGIVVSSDLNEYKITDLVESDSPIDSYGVGTEMITAKPVSAISGVYKLVEDNKGPKMKFSPGKISYPGRKQVYRIVESGFIQRDIIALEHEEVEGLPLLEIMIENGQRIVQKRDIDEIRDYALESVSRLPQNLRLVQVNERYKTEISPGLSEVITELSDKYQNRKPWVVNL